MPILTDSTAFDKGLTLPSSATVIPAILNAILPLYVCSKKANEIFADFRIFLNSTINAPYLYSDINCYTEIFAVFCIYISSRSLVIVLGPKLSRRTSSSAVPSVLRPLPHWFTHCLTSTYLELQRLFPLFPQNEPCTISLQAPSSLGHEFAIASSLPNLTI